MSACCFDTVRCTSPAQTGYNIIPPDPGEDVWTIELIDDLDASVVSGVLCLTVPLTMVPGLPIPDHAPINLDVINPMNQSANLIHAVSIEYI